MLAQGVALAPSQFEANFISAAHTAEAIDNPPGERGRGRIILQIAGDAGARARPRRCIVFGIGQHVAIPLGERAVDVAQRCRLEEEMAVAVGETPEADAARDGAEGLAVSLLDFLARKAGFAIIEQRAQFLPLHQRQALIGGQGIEHVAEPIRPPRTIATDIREDNALRQATDADRHLGVRAIGRVQIAEYLCETPEDVMARVQQIDPEAVANFVQREGRRGRQHLLEAPLVLGRCNAVNLQSVEHVLPRRLQQQIGHGALMGRDVEADCRPHVGTADAARRIERVRGRGEIRNGFAKCAGLGVVLVDDLTEATAQSGSIHATPVAVAPGASDGSRPGSTVTNGWAP